MANEVKIKVTADTNQAAGALKKFSSGAQDLQSAFQVLSQAAQTFGKIMEYGKGGAILTQTAQSFDTLTTKIGANKNLLDQLRKASRGTIDDQKLMSATATLLAGAEDGLAKSLADATPRLLEIAKAANKLNPALGDTSFLYESIATGVKRASPLILDNLGLTIKIGDANEEYAKSLGKSVTQLTAEEQKQALLNATLKAGQTLIDQAGGNADSAADAYARMETATKNLGDEIQMALAPAITDAAEATYTLLTYNKQIKGALNEHAGQVVKTAKSYEEYRQELERAANVAHMYVDEEGNLRDANHRLQQSNYALTEGMYNAKLAVEGLEGGFVGYASTLKTNATPAIQDANAAINAQKAALDLVMESLGSVTKEMIFNKAAADLDATAALALGRSMGVINEETYGALGLLAQLRDKYDSNKDGAIDAAEAAAGYTREVQALAGAINGLQDKTVTITTVYRDERENRGASSGGGGAFQLGGKPGEETGFATGGSFRVPPGYANDTYPLGPGRFASSGEIVTISPTININQAPGQSADALANAVIGKLGRMASKARRNGSSSIGM